MAQKHPGERGLCGVHHSGGSSLITSGSSVDPEILSFSGLRDSKETAPNGTRCLKEHSDPKCTQPPNPAHWSDPSHGPLRGPGPSREGGYPDESGTCSEESGVDQELSTENGRMGVLLFFPFRLLVTAREALGSLKGLVLRKETALLAAFATSAPLQPWGKMKS